MLMICIVCGVSGTGKSTIGRLLANRVNLPFFDADDFHSVANIQKMKNGNPLEDSDRLEWLKALSLHIKEWESNGGAVLACSALNCLHRRILVPYPQIEVKWITLEGERDLVLSRILNRNGHFFSAGLLDSQFEIYERPKNSWVFNIEYAPGEIVSDIIQRMSL